ncbi:MAG: PIG-L deacetylase family protein [Candidatus Helarchaeota archaeon]
MQILLFMRILLLSPHPDDIEFACGSTEVQLVKAGHEVIMACFTADEYGTDRNEFKGERISKIRRWEMREAVKVVGIKKLYWLGYIDGYSHFDLESVNLIKKFIEKIKPDIIFAPDPFYPLDSHIDHINLAKTVYYVWNKLKKKPLYLLYYTYKPNYYIPSKYNKIAAEAFKKHISQGFANPIFLYFNRTVKFIFGLFTPHAIFPEFFRIVGNIKNYKNPIKIPKIVSKLFSIIFYKASQKFMPERDLYKPTPEELGLKKFRFDLKI